MVKKTVAFRKRRAADTARWRERLGGPLHSESELEGTDQPFLGTTRPLDRLVQPLSEEPGSRVGPYKLL